MNRCLKYVLADDGKTPLAVEDTLLWGWWFQHSGAGRIVAQDETQWGMVSTVFLGLDHRFIGEGPPILWETMVFGGELDLEQVRYSSYDEARKGHAEMLKRVTTFVVTRES